PPNHPSGHTCGCDRCQTGRSVETFGWLRFRTMKRKWLTPVGLIALLVIGGGFLWHTGMLHRISSKDHLVALLRAGGSTGALLCDAARFSGMRILEFVVLSGLARAPALLASVLIGAGVSRGDYRSVMAVALLVLLAIGGYYWYQRSNVGASAPEERE